jgi:hypothetical protein
MLNAATGAVEANWQSNEVRWILPRGCQLNHLSLLIRHGAAGKLVRGFSERGGQTRQAI